MPKPPARDDSPLKPFRVVEGHMICDFDGNNVFGGERIMLTQAQAAYYQERGNVTFDMGAIFDEEEPEPEPSPTTSVAEGSNEPADDSAGAASVDATQSATAAPKPKRARRA